MIRVSTAMTIAESSQVGEVRRLASRCAEELKLGETAAGRAALVATELATNLVKHARGGSILLGTDDRPRPALILIALDAGPGIANVNAALRDGYSTAGSPGTGLGAISRGSSALEIYSLREKGSALLCRIEDDHPAWPHPRPAHRLVAAGICIAKSGEEEAGDDWDAVDGGALLTVMVADGLGHGPAAATASAAAIRALREHPGDPIEQLMRDAHALLRPTRGAAVSLARIDAAAGSLLFAGVGNVSGTVVTDEAVRKTISQPGIVGHEMRKLQSFSYPWMGESILVMTTDGVGTAWRLTDYPNLASHHPALIAAVIYRDFCRGTDDATVVVAKAS